MAAMATRVEYQQSAASDMSSLMAAMSDLAIPQYQIRKIATYFGASVSPEQPEDDENTIAEAAVLRLTGSEDCSSGKESPDMDRILHFNDTESKEIFSSQVVQLGMKLLQDSLTKRSSRSADGAVIRRNIHQGGEATSFPTWFADIPPAVRNLVRTAMALSTDKPVLLVGPGGCGKSTIISLIGEICDRKVRRVFFDSGSDLASLLGTVATEDTEAAGSDLKFTTGPLAAAIESGQWVVLEGLDGAPPDVLAGLQPLISEGSILLPHSSVPLVAPPEFQLFATAEKPVPGFWAQAVLEPIIKWDYTENVVEGSSVVNSMAVEDLVRCARGRYHVLNDGDEDTCEILRAFGKAFIAASSICETSMQRSMSMRDFLKFSGRLAEAKRTSGQLTRTRAFQEARDCFSRMHHPAKQLDIEKIICNFATELGPMTATDTTPELISSELRVSCGRFNIDFIDYSSQMRPSRSSLGLQMVGTKHLLRLLEIAFGCVVNNEPLLLVGETGIGKTAAVSELSRLLNVELISLNLSQQTDAADLIGCLKPMSQERTVFLKLRELYPTKRCDGLLARAERYFRQGRKSSLKKCVEHAARAICLSMVRKYRGVSLPDNLKSLVVDVEDNELENRPKKIIKNEAGNEAPKAAKKLQEWSNLVDSARLLTKPESYSGGRNKAEFVFSEGALVKAVRTGQWILLDEINLAPPDTLQRLAGLLETSKSGLMLTERGHLEDVERHPNFRLFAAMNPANDSGKKLLAAGIRSRFTEVYVPEPLDIRDLRLLVSSLLLSVPQAPIDPIVNFYIKAKSLMEKEGDLLSIPAPHYSLRTLTRSLKYMVYSASKIGVRKAVHDSLATTFLSPIPTSEPLRSTLESLLASTCKQVQHQGPPRKAAQQEKEDVQSIEVFGYRMPIPSGKSQDLAQNLATTGFQTESFILTPGIEKRAAELARAISFSAVPNLSLPILLQGPTSAGKTSMVAYLASCVGQKLVRINNHEHTDISEYLGSYSVTKDGKIQFEEGALVKALRSGSWVVLDELNLAPSDVVEALNRLLDDNRELFLPETGEVIKPAQGFMIFATQNPPGGAYGGRKPLSRAFRNRFVEVFIDNIAEDELSDIVSRRCSVAPSHAQKMVDAMSQLRLQRGEASGVGGVFAGKHALITPRDLFKWAGRKANTTAELAVEGFILLSGRLRARDDVERVREVISKGFKAEIDVSKIYDVDLNPALKNMIDIASSTKGENGIGNIAWTYSMRRLLYLSYKSVAAKEPLLLIGETGCGKTTVCQMLAAMNKKTLYIVNCHKFTDASDLIGSFRPVRERQKKIEDYQAKLSSLPAHFQELFPKSIETPSDYENTCILVEKIIQSEDSSARDALRLIHDTLLRCRSPFEWVDGPLVHAMKSGSYVLLDEINMVEDSVLERLNSVLETERSIFLAEMGGIAESLKAHEDFRVLATMNPSGDFGKRELSAALRNRFSEVYVMPEPMCTENEWGKHEDLASILKAALIQSECDNQKASEVAHVMVKFYHFMTANYKHTSIRDLFAWVECIQVLISEGFHLGHALVHGASASMIDSVGIGLGESEDMNHSKRLIALKELQRELIDIDIDSDIACGEMRSEESVANQRSTVEKKPDNLCGIHPFYIGVNLDFQRERKAIEDYFCIESQATRNNLRKVLRAMKIPRRAILLEGFPGIGKSAIVKAIAQASCHELIRINLSEATDMSDLLGSDIPDENRLNHKGEQQGFTWSDGSLLRAIKEGHWVLLDEINLASQAILEGLNALLDHRGEIFIPEIGMSFKAGKSFRIFATQNPYGHGGGRKGLPRSFISRFSKIILSPYSTEDLLSIIYTTTPTHLPRSLIEDMVSVCSKLGERFRSSTGGPFDFNLRDLTRWIEVTGETMSPLLDSADKICEKYCRMRAAETSYPILINRFRTADDRGRAASLVHTTIKVDSRQAELPRIPLLEVNPELIRCGVGWIPRKLGRSSSPTEAQSKLIPLKKGLQVLESIYCCANRGYWACCIVGEAGSGKTCATNLAAFLAGIRITTFQVTSATDVSDLVGGWEPKDSARLCRELVPTMNNLVENLAEIIAHNFARLNVNVGSLQQWVGCLCEIRSEVQAIRKVPTVKDQLSVFKASIEKLSGVCKDVSSIIERSDGRLMDQLHTIFDDISALESKIQTIAEDRDSRDQFEWVDGILPRAMELGEWLVLDDANSCTPAVFDKLNSLLEPQGTLYVDGDPHGNTLRSAKHGFLLILQLDPRKGGEISRAMRNRCVEIYMPGEDPSTALDLHDIFMENLNSIEKLNPARLGVIYSRVWKRMCNIHRQMNIKQYGEGIRSFSAWTGLLERLIKHNWRVVDALPLSLMQSYVTDWKQFQSTFDLIPENPVLPIMPSEQVMDTTNSVYLGYWQSINIARHALSGYEGDFRAKKYLEEYRALLYFLNVAGIEEASYDEEWSFLTRICIFAIQIVGNCRRSALVKKRSIWRKVLQAQSLPSKQAQLFERILSIVDSLIKSEACDLLERWTSRLESWQPGMDDEVDICEHIDSLGPAVLSPSAYNRDTCCLVEAYGDYYYAVMRSTFIQGMLLSSHDSLKMSSISSVFDSLAAIENYLLLKVSTATDKNAVKHVLCFLQDVCWSRISIAMSSIKGKEHSPHLLAMLHQSVHSFKQGFLAAKENGNRMGESKVLAENNDIWLHLDYSVAKFFESYNMPSCPPCPEAWKESLEIPIQDLATMSMPKIRENFYARNKKRAEILDLERMVRRSVGSSSSVSSIPISQLVKERDTISEGLYLLNKVLEDGSLSAEEIDQQFNKVTKGVEKCAEAINGDRGRHEFSLLPLKVNNKNRTTIHSDIMEVFLRLTWKVLLWVEERLLRHFTLHLATSFIQSRTSYDQMDSIVDDGLQVQLMFIGRPETDIVELRNMKSRKVQQLAYKSSLFEKWKWWQSHLRTWGQYFSEKPPLGVSGRSDYGSVVMEVTSLSIADVAIADATRQNECLSQAIRVLFLDHDSSSPTFFIMKHSWILLCELLLVISMEFKIDIAVQLKSTMASILEEKPQVQEFEMVWNALAASSGVKSILGSKMPKVLLELFDVSLSESDAKIWPGSPLMAFLYGSVQTLIGLLRLRFWITIIGKLDPAAGPKAQAFFLEWKADFLEQELTTQHDVLFRELGQVTRHPRLSKSRDSVKACHKEYLGALKYSIFRPHPNRTTELLEKLDDILENISETDRLIDLVCGVSKNVLSAANSEKLGRFRLVEYGSNEVVASLATTVDILSNAVIGLEEEYWQYPDLLQPASFALHEMRYGLRNLEAAAFLAVERSEHESKYIPVIEYLCSFPRAIHRDFAEFSSFALDLEQYVDEASLSSRVDAIALMVEIIHYRTLRNRGCSIKQSDHHEPLKLVTEIARLWLLLKNRRDDEIKEEQSTYRYIEPTDDFPCYIEDIESQDGAPKDPDGVESIEEGNQKNDHSSTAGLLDHIESVNVSGLIFDSICTSLEKARYSSGRGGESAFNSKHNVLDRFARGFDTAARLIERKPVLSQSVTSPLVRHGSIIRLSQSRAKFHVQETLTTQAQHYSTSISESLPVNDSVKSLKIRLSQLQKEWPNNAILQEIDFLSSQLLNRGIISTPPKLILSSLELIMSKVEMWNSNAPANLQFTEACKPALKLIKDWRRKELESWNSLLEDVEERFNRKSVKWLFHIYSIIFLQSLSTDESSSQKMDKAFIAKILESLEVFLQRSPIGEFQGRLKIIAMFAELPSNLSFYLRGLCSFYSQFREYIHAAIKQNRHAIDKELKDFCALFKWEDKSFYALKESSQRSTGKLNKMQRSLKEVLEEPASNHLQKLLDTIGNESSLAEIGRKFLQSFAVTQSLVHQFTENPKSLITDGPVLDGGAIDSDQMLDERDVETYHRFYEAIGHLWQADISRHTSTNCKIILSNGFIPDLADLIPRMRANLACCAPSQNVASKEIDKVTADQMIAKSSLEFVISGLDISLIQMKDENDHPARRKRRFQDWIKRAVKTGFHRSLVSSGDSHETELKYVPIEWIHENPAPSAHPKAFSTLIWSQATDDYYQAVSKFLAATKLRQNFSKSLSVREADIVYNTFRGFLKATQDQRSSVSATFRILHRFKTKRSEGNKLSRSVLELASQIVVFLEESIIYVEVQSGQASERISKCAFMREMLLKLRNAQSMVNYENDPAAVLRDELPSTFWEKVPKHLRGSDLPEEIQTSLIESTNEMFLLLKNGGDEREEQEAEHSKEQNTLRDGCCEKILLAAESLMAVSQKMNEPVPGIAPAQVGTSIVKEYDQSLSKCERAQDEFESLFPNAQDQLMPLFQILMASLRTLQYRMLLQHLRVSAGAKLLGDITCYFLRYGLDKDKGETEGEYDTNANGQWVEGTGMGEGEGEVDVSEQIENEDQMLGSHKGDKEETTEEDTRDKGHEDKSKGIEMQEEFEGDLHDLSDDESSDESNHDAEDEQEQLDNEVGDAGENAEVVDEKLWNNDKNENAGSDETPLEKPADKPGYDDNGEQYEGSERDDSKKKSAEDQNEHEDSSQEMDEKAPNEESPGDNTENEPQFGISKPQHDEDDPHSESPAQEHVDLEEEVECDNDQDNNDSKDNEEEPMGIDIEQLDLDSRDEEELPRSPNPEGADEETENLKDDNKTVPEVDDMEVEDSLYSDSANKMAEEETDLGPEGAPNISGKSSGNSQVNTFQPESYNETDELENRDKSEQPDDKEMGQDETYNNQLQGENIDNGRESFQDKRDAKASGERNSTADVEPSTERNLAEQVQEWARKADVVANEREPSENNDISGDSFAYETRDNTDKDSNKGALGNALEDQQTKMQVDGEEALPEDEKIDMEVDKEDDTSNLSDDNKDRLNGAQGALSDKKKTEMSEDSSPESQDEEVDAETRDNLKLDQLMESEVYLNQNDDISANMRGKGDEITTNLARKDTPNGDQPISPISILSWRNIDGQSRNIAHELCESLRTILEPTQASKLQGDYRSGKRLNMKRLIPFLASNYRKDKIWMRRQKPNKRTYQVILAVDDSKSMTQNKCGESALVAMACIARALTSLEVGQVGIVKFGQKGKCSVVHHPEKPFTDSDGEHLVKEFSFSQDNHVGDSPVQEMLDVVFQLVDQRPNSSSQEHVAQQLVLILADGRFQEREDLQRRVAHRLSVHRDSNRVLVAFIILDSPSSPIIEMKHVSFSEHGVTISSYMENFPFPYYLIMRDITSLPKKLSELIQQWIELFS